MRPNLAKQEARISEFTSKYCKLIPNPPNLCCFCFIFNVCFIVEHQRNGQDNQTNASASSVPVFEECSRIQGMRSFSSFQRWCWTLCSGEPKYAVSSFVSLHANPFFHIFNVHYFYFVLRIFESFDLCEIQLKLIFSNLT